MLPPVPPQLLARLAGLVLVGFSLPWAAASAYGVLFSLSSAPRGSPTGLILGSVLESLRMSSFEGIMAFLSTDLISWIGLAIGLYWTFVGDWPIRRIARLEYARG